MVQKLASFFIVISLLLSQAPFVFAQTLDTTMPAMEPVVEPATDSTSSPQADTIPPSFISIATASAEETEANIVWTTDELAYGYVEYGETNSYGLSTPKSNAAAMDGNASLTNLNPGSTYHYRIVAEDESGNIAYSEDRVVETAAEVVVMDNAPPEISSINISGVGTSTATISWATDELAQGKVEYGKTAGYGFATALAADYATEHSAALADLEANTEYHFRVVVQDESGNEAVSPDEIFTTDNIAPVSTPFAISHVEVSSIGTSTATIIWSTNEPANSQIFYGSGETYASSTPVQTASATSHQITLASLKSGTNYFYKVISKNSSGAIAEKSGFEFNTLYQEKKLAKAPVISNLSVSSIGTSTASIFWNTDIPAGGEVKYGVTTAYGTSDGGHTHLLTAHTHPLSGLSPGKRYNFAAIARDENGNETIYKNRSFQTLESQATASQGAANNADSGESQEPITDQTTEAPEAGAGGGNYSYSPTFTLSSPKLVKAEALDGQAMFVWNPKKPPKVSPGSTQIRTNIIIVRSSIRYAEIPTFGKVVYKGNAGLFTDANLENGKTYYYSIFTVNQFNSYSRPTYLKITPTNADEALTLEAVPSVVQKTPIYVFPKSLRKGDKNKHIEHLQVLLASEASLYPSGLITGYFGQLTESALKLFQKRYKIEATGIADNATLKKLEALSGIEIVKDKAAVFDSMFSRDLRLGLSGEDVSTLQQFLIDSQAYPEALVTGYFGPLTEKALQTFQQKQNIDPPLGYFGQLTKKRVLNLIRLRNISF